MGSLRNSASVLAVLFTSSLVSRVSFDYVFCFQITDACSACFEQRTVFTQQVLAKALGQMVCQGCTYRGKELLV